MTRESSLEETQFVESGCGVGNGDCSGGTGVGDGMSGVGVGTSVVGTLGAGKVKAIGVGCCSSSLGAPTQ